MADVQQFYCFIVREDHRDYLRFIWHQDNDLSKEIMAFRKKVHLFSHSPSPVVAIYSLRKAAEEGENEFDSDFKQCVLWNFYVDDALTSVPSNEEAMDLLKRTKKMLEQSHIKLHKIASNINSVMKAFPSEEQAKDLKDLNLSVDPLPLQ